ncbi:tetratricopeptide repeat protein [Dendronalium sp. ChiSLP03b]|uniref:tetratricopeptide repeat protein n=1 Tax=Dendronalium sp. ChiSLP03b TaxID=3075381 RepID=UPI002AD3CC33|nr:tetratricopeptide repeat protein [Dendronalium sp. ChiSLP03b]MDZ8206940.1 tetratricopeptide repeat protein [Dendronalium sp. ChiSLP03b]
MKLDSETLNQESSRILQHGYYEKYLRLTPEERTQQILAIQELLAEKHQLTSRQAELLVELGNLYFTEQDCTKALASYDQVLKIKPDYYYALFFRGTALDDLERYEQAVAYYDQALKFKPDDHDAWNNRRIALVKLQWQKFTQAVTIFLQIISFKR